MFDRILVAIDGSDCSLRAAQLAYELAELKRDILIDLVYVVSADREIDAMHSPEIFNQVQTGSIAFPAMHLFEQSPARVRCVRLYGRPADEVVKYAQKNKVDLIVIGSRGISGLEQITVGSVSKRVIKLTSCPVLIAK